MVVRKILIDLRRGRCLLKRDFHSFQNHDTHLKEFKLKVYLQETSSTIPKNWIYTKGVS